MRNSSIYTLSFNPREIVPGAVARQLDLMVHRLDQYRTASRTGSGMALGGPYVMFRIANDTEAIALSRLLTRTAQGKPRFRNIILSTGQGVHHRIISTEENNMAVKHTIKADGAAFSEDGHRFDTSTTGGNGHALCSCGATSEILKSRAARKLWHKGHAANPDTEENKPVNDDDVVGKVPAKKAAAKKAAPTKDEPTPAGPSREVDFETLGKYYAKSAGLHGAEVVGAVFEVTATLKGNTLTLHGPDEDTASVADHLRALWVAAKAAHREWRKTDKVYSEIDKSRKNAEANAQRFDLETAWFTLFMDGAADALADTVKRKGGAYKDGVKAIQEPAEPADDDVI